MLNKTKSAITFSGDPTASKTHERSHYDRRYILFLLVCVGILILPFLPGLHKLPVTYDPDAFYQLSNAHVIADAVRNYGEFPLWNPYFGGGFPWAGFVYNTGLSVGSLFYIAFGELIGTKLWIFVIMLLGSYGMYATAREWLGLKPSSALVGALFYATSAWLPSVLNSGDYDLMGFFLLPFVALCMLHLLQRRWLGMLLPVCFLTVIGAGAKVWPIIIAGTILVIALVYRAQSGRTAWAVSGMWALGLGVGLFLAAPKIIPMWYLMKMDLVNQVWNYKHCELCYPSFTDVFRFIILWVPGDDDNLQVGVGIAGTFFAICGILLDWRRSLGLLGILVLAVIFGLGPASPLPVGKILHVVPVLNMVGAYGMYASLVILFCVCGLAAIGFDRLRSLVALTRTETKKRAGTLTDMLIIVFVAVSIIYTAKLAMVSNGALFKLNDFTAPRETFYQVSDQSLAGVISRYRETPHDHLEANQYYNIRRGVGTITWSGNLVFPEHTSAKVLIDPNGKPFSQGGYLGEAYCIGSSGSGCEVSGLELTYNTIRFHLNAAKSSTVVLNFNYDSGWRASSIEVMSHEGLLAVRVPGGIRGEVMLRFSDRHFTAGLCLALAAVVLWSLGGGVWIRRNHDRVA